MTDDEDFEFQIQTSTGQRDVIMSKTALRRLACGTGGSGKMIVARCHDEILAIVERKIAKGRSGAGKIRIHGTDQ